MHLSKKYSIVGACAEFYEWQASRFWENLIFLWTQSLCGPVTRFQDNWLLVTSQMVKQFSWNMEVEHLGQLMKVLQISRELEQLLQIKFDLKNLMLPERTQKWISRQAGVGGRISQEVKGEVWYLFCRERVKVPFWSESASQAERVLTHITRAWVQLLTVGMRLFTQTPKESLIQSNEKALGRSWGREQTGMNQSSTTLTHSSLLSVSFLRRVLHFSSGFLFL